MRFAIAFAWTLTNPSPLSSLLLKFLRLLKKFLCDPALDCELEFLNIIFEQMDCCCLVGDFREKVNIGKMRFQDKGWVSP